MSDKGSILAARLPRYFHRSVLPSNYAVNATPLDTPGYAVANFEGKRLLAFNFYRLRGHACGQHPVLSTLLKGLYPGAKRVSVTEIVQVEQLFVYVSQQVQYA